MSHKRRLDKLEQQLPSGDDDGYTITEFAGDVLELIAMGHICDHDPELAHMSLLDPTVADDLSEDERSRAWSLLNESQKTVAEIARFTSWRSQAAADDEREWMGYRANSVAELRALMAEILNYAN